MMIQETCCLYFSHLLMAVILVIAWQQISDVADWLHVRAVKLRDHVWQDAT